MLWNVIPAALLALVAAAQQTALKAPGVPQDVKVSLRTSWEKQHILFDILEQTKLHNSTAFRPLLRQLAGLPGLPDLSPSEIYSHALELLPEHISPSSVSAWKLGLAAKESSAMVEAFISLYYDFAAEIKDEEVKDMLTSCAAAVWYKGQLGCGLDGAKKVFERKDDDYSSVSSSATIYPFDNTPTPEVAQSDPAILYFHPTYLSLSELLDILESTEVPFLIRYRPDPLSQSEGDGAAVQGWGVEMVLKKMEYSAVNDRKTVATDSNNVASVKDVKEAEIKINPFADSLGENTWAEATVPLTEIELGTLPLFTVPLIKDHADPFFALEAFSQNFPLYGAALVRSQVENATLMTSEETAPKDLVLLERTIWRNRRIWEQISMSEYGLWLNGQEITEKDSSVFQLLPVIRSSQAIVESLRSLGLSTSSAHGVLSLSSAASEDPLRNIIDVSDRLEGGEVITWWNDVEKDKRYSQWSSELKTLTTSQGGFPQLRRNVFNVVVPLNLGLLNDLAVIIGPVNQLISRGFGIRFGMVPIINETISESAIATKVILHTIENYGRATTMNLMSQFIQQSAPSPVISQTAMRSLYNRMISNQEPIKEGAVILNFDQLIAEPLNTKVFHDYADRLDVSDGHIAFINGKMVDRDDNQAWLRSLQMELGAQIQVLTEMVYNRVVTEKASKPIDLSNFWYDLPDTPKTRNRLISEGTVSNKLAAVDVAKIAEIVGPVIGDSWVYPDGTGTPPLSIWIIGDLDSVRGTLLVEAAFESLTSTTQSRIGFLHIPTEGTTIASTSHVLYEALSASKTGVITESHLLSKLDPSNPPTNSEAAANFWAATLPLRDVVPVPEGDVAIIINGRLVGPIGNLKFNSADFVALGKHELQERVAPLQKYLSEFHESFGLMTTKEAGDLVSRTSAIVTGATVSQMSTAMFGAASRSTRNRNHENLSQELVTVESGDSTTAVTKIVAVVDPLSESTQKLSTLLRVLSQMDGVHVKVILLPPTTLTEVPIKRFYRFHLEAVPGFSSDGQEEYPVTIFEDLPKEPIFTMGMDTPPSWLVRPIKSVHDLDNIRLSDIDGDVDVMFHLENLVVEGHARDSFSGAPPRGVQLQISNKAADVLGDTLVVANLGYFQFKALPGVLSLSIREGRGRDIFQLESVGDAGWSSPVLTGDQIPEFTLTSFSGVTLYPRFKRNPGMERADVLAPVPQTESVVASVASIASRLSSFLWKQPELTNELVVKKNADINIFTVASGLLYERFTFIMVLSVMKHTNSTVKFWFIENFLSPSFLEFIPHMAATYGFEYELITYKWPSWLRHQKEKQRTIWGYKILFLDVLFPMDLDKVIFVDADQIVRTDLLELVHMDLEGAPYGYTPMGDDRPEVEGFRFWKTGYWKDALRGRPYHISALYVIDLVKFREIAAGDRLRGQYQALSADPNSLANLDQDLPNSMQEQIPIFSLDKNWLWCATWCSADRLSEAKTIDLCQDPLTKAPKLDRARSIPEWTEYDNTIQALRDEFDAVVAGELENDGIEEVAPIRAEHVKDEL